MMSLLLILMTVFSTAPVHAGETGNRFPDSVSSESEFAEVHSEGEDMDQDPAEDDYGAVQQPVLTDEDAEEDAQSEASSGMPAEENDELLSELSDGNAAAVASRQSEEGENEFSSENHSPDEMQTADPSSEEVQEGLEPGSIPIEEGSPADAVSPGTEQLEEGVPDGQELPEAELPEDSESGLEDDLSEDEDALEEGEAKKDLADGETEKTEDTELREMIGDLEIIVCAPGDILPDSTKLIVEWVNPVEALSYVNAASEYAREKEDAAFASRILVLDISLEDENGRRFEPGEQVSVTIRNIVKNAPEMEKEEHIEVYHVKDGDVGSIENVGASENGDDLSFETSSFSPFVIMQVDAGSDDRYRPDVQYLTADESTGGGYFSYTGTTEVWVCPKEGVYHLEAIGAGTGGPDGSLIDRRRGSSNSYGYGGYAEGYINLNEGDTIYVTVGGAGSPSTQKTMSSGGFNGGGNGFYGAYSGGGATSFASVKLGDGTLANYAAAADRNKVLLVAGGAGGFGTGNPYHGGNGNAPWKAPNGAGGGETTIPMYAFDSTTVITEATTQTTGYSFGRGENSLQIRSGNSYAAGGAGGGGWMGGKSTTYYHDEAGAGGGTGGSGYVNVSKSAPLHLTRGRTFCVWAPVDDGYAERTLFGHGEAAINYVGDITSTVTLSLNGNAVCNGESGEVKIEGRRGTTIDLTELVVPNSGNTILGWKLIYGDGVLEEGTWKYTFGEEDSSLYPVIFSNFDLYSTVQSSGEPEFREYTYNDQALLKWDEAGFNNEKNYKAYQSVDGGEYKELRFSEYEHVEASPAEYYYTGKSQTYTAPFDGTYTVYLYGGNGGGDGGSKGGKGAYLKGTLKMEQGDVLTVNVGGAGRSSSGSSGNTTKGGWNGGGDCWWSGSGAGCTDIYLNDTRIAAAAGGGGATNGRSGKAGRVSTGATDHLTSSKNGGSNGRYDAGSGGGGWRGGSMGITETTGDPKATGGWGGINGFTDAFTMLEESSDALASGSKGGNNGYVLIVPPQAGDIYKKQTALVDTSDLAAPEIPYDGAVKAVNDGNASMIWYEPADHGTTYSHYVEAIALEDGTNLGKSNITTDSIVSGTAGYFYYYDKEPEGSAGASHSYTESTEVTIPILPDAPKTYLHVAAVDRAGNIGPTAHIPVDAYIRITGSVSWVDKDNKWNLRPESDTITIYQDGNEYGTVTLNTENSYAVYSFDNLPAGHMYTVSQQDVTPYDAEQSQYDFVNSIALDTEKAVLDRSGESIDGELLIPGDVITYRITVTNNTLQERRVEVYDQLPWYLDYVTGDDCITLLYTDEEAAAYGKTAPAPVPGILDRVTPVIAASGTIPAMQELSMTFTARVKYSANGKTIRNMAHVFYENVYEEDGKTPLDVATNEVANPVKEMPAGTITIRKSVDELYSPYGVQSFLFTIEGKDTAGDPHTYHAQITMDGTNGTAVLSGIPQGTYTVTEVSGIRYALKEILAVKNAVVSGSSATVTINQDTGNEAEMEFRNEIKDYSGLSHTAIIVNHFEVENSDG